MMPLRSGFHLADVWTSVPEEVGLTDEYWLRDEYTYHTSHRLMQDRGVSVTPCMMTLGARRHIQRDGVVYEFFPVDDTSVPLRQQRSSPLLEFLSGGGYQLIVVHLLNRVMTGLVLDPRLTKVARILHLNSYYLHGSTLACLHRWPNCVARAIANAPSLAQAFADLGVMARDRIVTISSAIDVERFCPRKGVRKRWDLVWTGQLRRHDEKHLDRLVDIASRTRASLLIVGDGDGRGRLEQKVVRAKLSNRVRFQGWVHYTEIPSLLQQSRVYATTADLDPAPRSLSEAMACGLPIVALRPGIGLESQIADGINGFLTSSDAEMSAVIDRLLSNRTCLRVMGQASRCRAEELFNPHRRIQTLLDLYLDTYRELQS